VQIYLSMTLIHPIIFISREKSFFFARLKVTCKVKLQDLLQDIVTKRDVFHSRILHKDLIQVLHIISPGRILRKIFKVLSKSSLNINPNYFVHANMVDSPKLLKPDASSIVQTQTHLHSGAHTLDTCKH